MYEEMDAYINLSQLKAFPQELLIDRNKRLSVPLQALKAQNLPTD